MRRSGCEPTTKFAADGTNGTVVGPLLGPGPGTIHTVFRARVQSDKAQRAPGCGTDGCSAASSKVRASLSASDICDLAEPGSLPARPMCESRRLEDQENIDSGPNRGLP